MVEVCFLLSAFLVLNVVIIIIFVIITIVVIFIIVIIIIIIIIIIIRRLMIQMHWVGIWQELFAPSQLPPFSFLTHCKATIIIHCIKRDLLPMSLQEPHWQSLWHDGS